MEQLIFIVLVGVFALGKWLLENSGKFSGGPSPDDRREDEAERGEGRRASGRHQPLPSETENEEERMRRFMEALGLPPGSETPPQPRNPPVPAYKPGQPPRPQPSAPPRLPRRREPTAGNPWEPRPRKIRPEIRKSREFSEPLRPAEPAEPAVPIPPVPDHPSMQTVAPRMEVTSIPEIEFRSAESYVAAAPVGMELPESLSLKPETASADAAASRKSPVAAGPLRTQLRDAAAVRRAFVLKEILGPCKALQE